MQQKCKRARQSNGILEDEARQSFQRWLLEINIVLIILTRCTRSGA